MWVELFVAGAISGSAFFHRGSDSGTSLISMAISTARIVSPKSTVSFFFAKRQSSGQRTQKHEMQDFRRKL